MSSLRTTNSFSSSMFLLLSMSASSLNASLSRYSYSIFNCVSIETTVVSANGPGLIGIGSIKVFSMKGLDGVSGLKAVLV